jgi:Cu-processing system permease protein
VKPRAVGLIAKTVLIEAVRRKEIYAIVLVSTLLIGVVMTVDFFDIEGLSKFYREVALKIMGVATALTVVVLSARQLPREFEKRTIYPLLAKPVSRMTFLAGKLFGVMLAAAFCFLLFMVIYVLGTWYIGDQIPWGLFLQYIYLQMLMMLILATLGFWLSMVLNLDAAITIGALFYALAAMITSVTTFIYDMVSAWQQTVLLVLTYVIPQLTLFDLSEKATHASAWEPLGWSTMGMLTIYGMIYVVIFFSLGVLSFYRRPL